MFLQQDGDAVVVRTSFDYVDRNPEEELRVWLEDILEVNWVLDLQKHAHELRYGFSPVIEDFEVVPLRIVKFFEDHEGVLQDFRHVVALEIC